METIMIRERYKVVRVLEEDWDYAFAEAVDISERETPIRFINVYEGVLLPVYARVFPDLQNCEDFCEAFLVDKSLVAIFRSCNGTPIDQVFYRGAKWGWEDRLLFAEALLHQALCLADLPFAVGCAALLSENVRVKVDEKKISLSFHIRPMEEMNARELALLAADQALKILEARFDVGDAEYAFCEQLKSGTFSSVVALYAAWRHAAEDMKAEYEELDKKNAARRGLDFLKKNFRRIIRRNRR